MKYYTGTRFAGSLRALSLKPARSAYIQTIFYGSPKHPTKLLHPKPLNPNLPCPPPPAWISTEACARRVLEQMPQDLKAAFWSVWALLGIVVLVRFLWGPKP